MKKVILILLVSLGLQTQAQISPCDSMTVTGSQYQLTMEVNNINTIIDYWVTTAPDMTILGEDSMTNTHTVLNSNPMSFVPYDTLITCITSSSAQITCCVTWVWNGTMWMNMGNTTGIQEVEANYILDNKIYDLMGREIVKAKGLYIKNNKLYFND